MNSKPSKTWPGSPRARVMQAKRRAQVPSAGRKVTSHFPVGFSPFDVTQYYDEHIRGSIEKNSGHLGSAIEQEDCNGRVGGGWTPSLPSLSL